MVTHSEPPDRYAARPELLAPDAYPALRTVSAGHLFRAVIVPRIEPGPAEFVYIPCRDRDLGQLNAITEWNLLWECGHIRPDGLAERVPAKVRELADRYPEQSFRFAPLTRTFGKASAYEPLRSLLPLPVLQRFGLQPRVCVWPSLIPERGGSPDEVERLSRALAFHLWPLICSGSPPSAFSSTEPISLLAHGLDFWLPYLDLVIQGSVKAAGRVPYKTEQERREVA